MGISHQQLQTLCDAFFNAVTLGIEYSNPV